MTGLNIPAAPRWAILIVISVLAGYASYKLAGPSVVVPEVTMSQVYPASSGALDILDRSFSLSPAENPLRNEALALMSEDQTKGWILYNEIVEAGRARYYHGCFACHGEWLNGTVPAQAAGAGESGTPNPLQAAFALWRIDIGGSEQEKTPETQAPAIPVAHKRLDETKVWQIITFLTDSAGLVPQLDMAEAASKNPPLMDMALYQQRCAVCHGEHGANDGPASKRMYPQPRDFSLALFKYKTSPGTLPPRDSDLFHTIKRGLTESGMPAWGNFLSDAQIDSLIPVIKGFDITAAWAPEDADEDDFDEEGYYLKTDFLQISEIEPVTGQVSFSEKSIAQGKVAFDKICIKCHGPEGRGNITTAKSWLEDDWNNRIWPRDLSKPWTWRVTQADGPEAQSREQTIRNIYTRLSIGLPGTPMPAHRATEAGNRDPLGAEDRWHVANYVYSLRQKSVPLGDKPLIQALRVTGPLPDSLDDAAWENTPAVSLRLWPNIIKQERLTTPLNDAVTVRVLYNDEDIAFLLEVNDRTDSRPGEKVSMRVQDRRYRLNPDALAIRFPRVDAVETGPQLLIPHYLHGNNTNPTTQWYWNAGSLEPPQPASKLLMDAIGPAQKLTLRTNDHSLDAQGQWEQGRWRVLMKHPREASNGRDVSFNEGLLIPVSFLNWDGSNGEILDRNTRTPWYWLVLSAPTETDQGLVLPVGVSVGVLLLGFLLMRVQRSRGRS
ncbi:MAG: c-type cytochrome [Gammaproteobacteria bacterium]|nr:c-type cytochrome [Gammaproteobacteria bacterium]